MSTDFGEACGVARRYDDMLNLPGFIIIIMSEENDRFIFHIYDEIHGDLFVL